MFFKRERRAYVDMFGPTTGDRVRLADTDLIIEVEKDFTTYGEEVKFGGGDGGRLQSLHQHRVLAVGRGHAVRAVVLDRLELVQLVLAQSLRAQPRDAQRKPGDERRGQQKNQRRATERARVQVAEQVGHQRSEEHTSELQSRGLIS